MKVYETQIEEDNLMDSKRKRLSMFLKIMLSYVAVFLMVQSTEQLYQVPKDGYFCGALVIFLALIISIKGRRLNKKITIVSLAAGIAIMGICFVIKHVSVKNYGPIYFAVIALSWVIAILSVSIIVDSFAGESLSNIFKRKSIVLFIAAFVIPVVFDTRELLPIVLVILSLYTTEIDAEGCERLLESFAIGYYIAFIHMTVDSLVKNPDRYEVGRYLGSFSQVESAGMFCGGALLCAIYICIRYCNNKKKYLYAVWAGLIFGPLYMTLKVSSRSTLIALAGFAFLYVCFRKGFTNARKPLIIIGIAIITVAIGLGVLAVYSHHLTEVVDPSKSSELSYAKRRIYMFTAEQYRNGYFGNNSLLNSINALMSGRLSGWAESIKQIGWRGHAYEAVDIAFSTKAEYIGTPHNFPILWFVNYGIIGGLTVVVWYVGCVIGMLKADLGRKRLTFLPRAWAMYSVGLFLFSCVNWKYSVAFIFLVMQCINSKTEKSSHEWDE